MLIKNYKILLSALFLFVWQNNFAQNFNYQLTKDSAVYAELISSTTLLGNESFIAKSPVLHLPYSFNFCGSLTDSIIVETNGFLVFNKNKELALVSFNNFSGNIDSLGNNVATINYTTNGSIGNRITKIEFKSLSINTFTYSDNLSYQVWLYENGSHIEFHIGSSSHSQIESSQQVLMGLVNRNMDFESHNALLITGNPSSPVQELFNIGENNMGVLNAFPYSGIIYRLSPVY